MASILEKIGAYVFIIALGWFLRSRGMFSQADARRLGVLIVNVTLPAALIRNADAIIVGPELPLLAFIAVAASLITLYAGFLLAKKKRNPETSAIMLTTSTYNVGGFLLPFVEMFYPGTGVAYLCMFDIGNAVMGLGISYALAKAASDPDRKLTFPSMMKTLFSSVPFVTYLILFGFSLFSLHLPQIVIDFADVIGNANGFLSMFMIGILIDFSIPKAEFRQISIVSLARFSINLLLMTLVCLIPGAPVFMKLIAALCLASPVATASVVYSMECGYQGDLTGMVSSASILISIAEIIAMILLFGQGFIVA